VPSSDTLLSEVRKFADPAFDGFVGFPETSDGVARAWMTAYHTYAKVGGIGAVPNGVLFDATLEPAIALWNEDPLPYADAVTGARNFGTKLDAVFASFWTTSLPAFAAVGVAGVAYAPTLSLPFQLAIADNVVSMALPNEPATTFLVPMVAAIHDATVAVTLTIGGNPVLLGESL